MKIAKLRIENFKDEVWKYWNRYGRHELAWRKTKNPYRILVSEVMLQQTQVARVTEKYPEFLAAFPTVHKLAKAPPSQVLKVWSGMEYNRRAKYLRDFAKVIVVSHLPTLKDSFPVHFIVEKSSLGSYVRVEERG